MLKINNIAYTDYTELLSALENLPSPLETPRHYSLWNNRSHTVWNEVRNFIRKVPREKSALLQLLCELEQSREWLNLYHLCGVTYKKALIGKFDLTVEERSLILSASSKSYQLLQADYLENAFSVEQREYGISSNEPIGTHNLQDCLGLFFWDKNSRIMSFTHLDNATDLNSLELAMSCFSEQDYIDCTLIGARFNEDLTSDLSKSSIGNLTAALEYLKDKNINIIQAEIGRSMKLLATAVVGEPLTGKIYRAFPQHRQYRELLTALAWKGNFGSWGHPRRDPLSPALPYSDCIDSVKARINNDELVLPSDTDEFSLFYKFTKQARVNKSAIPTIRRLPVIINMYKHALAQRAAFIASH